MTSIGATAVPGRPTKKMPDACPLSKALYSRWHQHVRARMERYLLTPCSSCARPTSMTHTADQLVVGKATLWRFVWKNSPIVWSFLVDIDKFLSERNY